MEVRPRSSAGKMEKMRLNVPDRESSRGICLQVLPPYLLAGLAMEAAGMLLDQVQVSEGNSLESFQIAVCKVKNGMELVRRLTRPSGLYEGPNPGLGLVTLTSKQGRSKQLHIR